ncbi:biopolymer transporter ExbD [Sulfitobacter albidus]|uniref:Biopolymer transporter ExbD n=1 Tax=Sulfitobacter albidus TaxID=2829501 RepID=A0A975JGN1_9RHOB|nr:biopolymer transporter ExbD [Sulfitobacter albidus]QUJ78113.1 biopolymer transporter ExbD [Sulfitobacter albidus]
MSLRLPPRRPPLVIDSGLAIVNIVLLLIFFFLTTGSLSSTRDFTVSLPDTSELPLDLLPDPLLVLDANGGMTLDGVAVAQGDLAEALGDNPALHVLAERDANAGVLLDTLAAEALIAVEVRLVTVHRRAAGNGSP